MVKNSNLIISSSGVLNEKFDASYTKNSNDYEYDVVVVEEVAVQQQQIHSMKG